MGFPGYFLIVWDFINWAKEHGIPVGPGRGSGAGSLVAYAMRITDIDPLPFNLLFERFLNPERVSMPDFDVDFCMNRRDEVIKYVQEKYGREQVGQIATFHQLKARGVIKDVARAMEIPFAEADKLAKLVPEPVAGKTTPVGGDREGAELKALYDSEPDAPGAPRHRRVARGPQPPRRHARRRRRHRREAPLGVRAPSSRPDGELVTQFAKDEVEQAGLVKFDFLGLKTLTVIQTAVELINRGKSPEQRLDLDNKLPLTDAGVYRCSSAAATPKACSSSSRADSRSSSRSCAPTSSRTSSPRWRSTARAR
jgi:DNA polymerase-3 subunit alpha